MCGLVAARTRTMVIRPLLILSSLQDMLHHTQGNAISKAGAQVWTQNVEQLDGDEYSPSGAIVARSTGDLIFAINRTGISERSDEHMSDSAHDPTRALSTRFTLLFLLSSRFQTRLNKSLPRSQTTTSTSPLHSQPRRPIRSRVDCDWNRSLTPSEPDSLLLQARMSGIMLGSTV